VFLTEPESTPYDLRWRMFDTDVRVHPFFWLCSVLLGWSALQLGVAYLLLWVACVFVSILVHEMGHVLMGRVFGTRGHIVLYTFGGLAIGSNALSNPWKRIAVSFAGPLAGFILAVPVTLAWFGLGFQNAEEPSLAVEALDDLMWINWTWGILNLFPIWPLDGGQISRDFLGWLRPANGVRIAYGISIAVAGLLAAYFLYKGVTYSAIFFALLAVGSFQAFQAETTRGPWERQRQMRRSPWEREDDWWKR
jgi:Zn-dependent protease